MSKALVGVIMGSTSDWETMKEACTILEDLEITYEKKVVSAHRTPDEMFLYAEGALERGIEVIIAGAGGAATYQVWLLRRRFCLSLVSPLNHLH